MRPWKPYRRKTPCIRDDFDNCYAPEPNSGCWLWLRHLVDGYGKFYLTRGKMIGAHVFSYERAYGPVPAGKYVLHKCDVRSCVNPEHLYVGTKRDNANDKLLRNGQYNMRLTVTDISLILADTRCQREIARAYGISQPHVSKIKRGRRWNMAPHIR